MTTPNRISDGLAERVKLAISDGILISDFHAMVADTVSKTQRRLQLFGAGTPTRKLAHSDGRHRRKVGKRTLHATKGWYGGKKSSRRSNRTAGARK